MGAAPLPWDHNDLDVHDMVSELTRIHTHREHYVVQHGATTYGRHHQTKVPALLDQLEHGVPSGRGDERSGAGYESRPAARLETLDALILIDHEASRWVRQYGHDDAGMTTVECVTKIGSLIPSLDKCNRRKPVRHAGQIICCGWHSAEHDVRRWWTQARIVAGWDNAAWRPDATCPICGVRGGLRVRFSANVAMCVGRSEGDDGRRVACGETWDPSTIYLLARHIREESFNSRPGRPEPCWCPFPTPVDRMGPLCRVCGSARCHRAISAGLEAA